MAFAYHLMQPEKARLAEDLKKRIDGCRARARTNYYAAYGVGIVGFVASIIASISVASEWHHKGLVATIAALPAVVVGLTSFFKFEARSDWWWEKHHKLNAFLSALIYE